MRLPSSAHAESGRTFISILIGVLMLLHVRFSCSLTRDVTKLVRIYVADPLQIDTPYQIDEKNCHYITSVMRLKVGSSFRIFNGRDGEFVCDIESISRNKKSALGMISKQIRLQEDHRQLPIVLYCASLKKPRMKLLLEKVTELGVKDVILVKTQNANADYEDTESLASLGRVCIESAEQCERLSIPRLLKSISFDDLSSHWSMMSKVDAARASGQQTGLKLSRLLVCRERFPGGEPLLQVLLAARSADSTSEMDTEIALASSFKLDRQILGIFVGPEGGFTETEVANMAELSQTFQFVTLGDSVLRAETAAISAVSTVGAAVDFLTFRDKQSRCSLSIVSSKLNGAK